MPPLFTIGVTTYNRKEMLKECLASISQQKFSDYEVIVGNNYTEEVLTKESLGITDTRISVVNHPCNLEQLGNMNYLLSKAKGRYFSWLADDDLLAPQCLVSMSTALKQFSYPKCVFSSYDEGSEYKPDPIVDANICSRLINGDVFLQQYLSRKLKLIGCYGGLETEYLRELGGVRKLGISFSPYADLLFAIEAGMLDKVAYVDFPLFFFRTHDQSISYTSSDLNAYTSAQQELLSRCEIILKHDNLIQDSKVNMFHLLMWCSGDIYEVLSRGSLLFPRSFIIHMRVLEKYARGITRWLYFKFLSLNLWLAFKYLVRRMIKKWRG